MGWECPQCGEENVDQFGVCWNCGLEHAEVQPEASISVEFIEPAPSTPQKLACLRCSAELSYLGRKRFDELASGAPFLLADAQGLFVNRNSFDLFACPGCGKLECFIAPEGE